MKRKDRIKKKYLDFSKKSLTKQSEPENKPDKQESNSFYYKHYKPLIIVPFVVLLIAIVLILIQTATTGNFINKGITLQGGISVQVPGSTLNADEIRDQMRQSFPNNEVIIRTLESQGEQSGITIESNILPDNVEQTEAFKQRITEITGVNEREMSIQTIGSALGDAFFKQTMVAVIIAFIFMGLVVFLYFKTLIPSAAVILSAFSDIIVTIAILNIMEYKIGTAGIAALLMLIGYSVDTDILLTTRVLKSTEGTVYQRMINSMKTGMTMTITTLVAVTITYFVAQSEVLKEIMLIIIIGLIVDIFNTWLQNAGILRYYMEKKQEKEAQNGEA